MLNEFIPPRAPKKILARSPSVFENLKIFYHSHDHVELLNDVWLKLEVNGDIYRPKKYSQNIQIEASAERILIFLLTRFWNLFLGIYRFLRVNTL